jgi:hypothetical protein
MPTETAIHQWYAMYGMHRTVASKLNLPLHYVMFVLGLMDETLFHEVNGPC